MWTGDDLYFMRLALEAAEDADRAFEVPIGAVLVHQGHIIGRGYNCPIKECDPTAHAEIMALRSAGQWLQNYRMAGSTLYVTLEPCLMCFGALTHARVERVVFGAHDPKVGVTRLQDTLAQANLNHRIQLEGGLLEEDCRRMVQLFFQRKRSS
nr:tRNA adenosine(34) deaminase TadA [uncultured Holophaga sp.]